MKILFVLIVLFSSLCPCLVSLRENRAEARLLAPPRGGRKQVDRTLRLMDARLFKHAVSQHKGECPISCGYGISAAECRRIRYRLRKLAHIADAAVFVVNIHRVAVNAAGCYCICHLFASPFPPWAFGARAGKEEGAIPIRESVEALEKPMSLAKGNAPKVGAFRASRTLMLNFPGFDRVHR